MASIQISLSGSYGDTQQVPRISPVNSQDKGNQIPNFFFFFPFFQGHANPMTETADLESFSRCANTTYGPPGLHTRGRYSHRDADSGTGRMGPS